MTIGKNIILSETIYVSRAVKRQLSVLAALSAAASGADIPDVNALANEILAKHLASIPDIEQREADLKKALKDIEAKYTVSNLTPPPHANRL